MSSATLQEQETKQPLLTHVIFMDSEDRVPIVCFTVDTSRPTTTSLAPHHAYANRCPVLLWYARMCLPSQPWHGTGRADRTPEQLDWFPVPGDIRSHMLLVLFLVQQYLKILKENKGLLGQIHMVIWERMISTPNRQKEQLISMFHYRGLTYPRVAERSWNYCYLKPTLSSVLLFCLWSARWLGTFPLPLWSSPRQLLRELLLQRKEQWFSTSQTFL